MRRPTDRPSSSATPVVAVSGPERFGGTAWWCTRLALARAGARARRLRPGGRTELDADALVLGGGTDLDPALYGQVPAGAVDVDAARDRYELALLEHALRRGLPVLGICRGMQLVNIALGGTLHQEIPGRPGAPRLRQFAVLVRRRVMVAPDTRLADHLGREELRVNSLHHQAVHRPADALRVSAVDEDGVVQGVEDPDRPFLVGVQWHPEYLPLQPSQRRLFRRLVAAARG
ncbi:MAG: gamma-glutamyl-gamma-aminobutyrate hydrolase family protein [Ectothiorhodospiraceae bacterium]|nr:gamma-glutamyl-gamma-aminobutyrate hydrolase family protein [Chromatiales bacterium]MCP5155517.1 gamma-glutamyl-gamma-aminobutyrate hydrolase family protein [Ectothiorhodospiraceae bacterium]